MQPDSNVPEIFLRQVSAEWLDPRDKNSIDSTRTPDSVSTLDTPTWKDSPLRRHSNNTKWETLIGKLSRDSFNNENGVTPSSSISKANAKSSSKDAKKLSTAARFAEKLNSMSYINDVSPSTSSSSPMPKSSNVLSHMKEIKHDQQDQRQSKQKPHHQLESWFERNFPFPTFPDIAIGAIIAEEQERKILTIFVFRFIMFACNIAIALDILLLSDLPDKISIPKSQLCFMLAFILIPVTLVICTAFSRHLDMKAHPPPIHTKHWYWALLALCVHLAYVLAQGDFISFVVFHTFPGLQPVSSGAFKLSRVPLLSNLAIQRYIMLLTSLIELFLAIVPQHYLFATVVLSWCAIWELGSFVVGSNRFISGVNALVPAVAIFVVVCLSGINVLIYQTLLFHRSKRAALLKSTAKQNQIQAGEELFYGEGINTGSNAV